VNHGTVNAAYDPGNLDSGLFRHVPWLLREVMRWTYLHPVSMGAYAPLYAGWCEDVGLHNNGAWVVPWGRLSAVRSDVRRAMGKKVDGGGGDAERFWEWCERETADFI
jgi:retinol dehydrogenase 12